MNQLDVPDFELGELPGGVVSQYSDGVPTISYSLVDRAGFELQAHGHKVSFTSPLAGVTGDIGVTHHVTEGSVHGEPARLAASTNGYTTAQGDVASRVISHALLSKSTHHASETTPETAPAVSYSLLGAAGNTIDSYGEAREYYAASTVKLAVAAAMLLRVDAGTHSLEHTIPSTSTYASRIAGSPAFTIGAGEADPGMPAEGTPVSLGWCLERMITHSSNETTNLLTEFIGLDAVDAACKQLGVTEVSMTRLICDYDAILAGFTHTATTRGLARLLWELTCGERLSAASREHMLKLLRAQYFPIISYGLPEGTVWGSKSGWDDGIRHDVAVIGEPGTAGFRVLAVCTEGFTPRGAIELIAVLTRAIDPTRTRS